MKAREVTALLALAMACAACSHADKPVPRREAYARIEPYAHEYTAIGADSVPVALRAAKGAAATVSRGGKGAWWVTIAYPRYRAGIYATILPASAEQMPQLLADRMERLALDMGSAMPQLEEWTRGRFTGITAIAPWNLATPAKLIAHDGTHIVSATVVCDGYADADELAPVVSELICDLEQLLPDDGD